MKLTKNNEESTDINELVFFGRLETRKGLELFADALDRLSVTRPEFAGTKITFLGSVANIGNNIRGRYSVLLLLLLTFNRKSNSY